MIRFLTKGRLARYVSVALLSTGVLFGFWMPLPVSQATDPSFVFTAAGDYGANAATTATLDGIAAANPAFHLAIGDLSYSQITPESAWCNYVKSRVGSTLPFELLAGNHEDDNGSDGFIDNFAACLPDRLGNITGAYARQYYLPPAFSAALVWLSPSCHSK